MIQTKDEEFVSQLRLHLTKGLMDARRSEVAEVQAATSRQRDLISRLESEVQYFAGELAESRSETSWLRHRYGDFAHASTEQWGREREGEYERDEIHQWYQSSGVGLDEAERIAGTAAPMVPVSHPVVREPDIVNVARKAAQAAAMEHSMNHSKTYEKLNVPPFPRSGEMTNWTYSLGIATVVAGGFGDEQEVKWLGECWKISFDELEQSELDGVGRGLTSLYHAPFKA